MNQDTCIHKSIALSHGKTQSLIHVPCTAVATQSGYCATHQYAARLLDKARYYGCPELLPQAAKKDKDGEGLIVRRGYRNWQAYCEVVSQANAERIEKRLDAEYGHMFKREGVA